LVLDFPRFDGVPGRPRELADDAYADQGYGSESTRAPLRWPGIEPRIADLGRTFETFSDMSKSRALGFLEYQKSDASFLALFSRLRKERNIP
jgi:hypothetical protein